MNQCGTVALAEHEVARHIDDGSKPHGAESSETERMARVALLKRSTPYFPSDFSKTASKAERKILPRNCFHIEMKRHCLICQYPPESNKLSRY